MTLRKGRGYRRGRIEIIPMIDVMFFLLVTFMLASLSMQSLNSITVNLPQGDAPNLQHKEPVALTITKDSKIFLDKAPTTLSTMAFTLKSMLQGQDQGVVVNADGAAPEGNVRQDASGNNEFKPAQTAIHEVQDKRSNSLLSRGYHDRERDRLGDPALV